VHEVRRHLSLGYGAVGSRIRETSCGVRNSAGPTSSQDVSSGRRRARPAFRVGYGYGYKILDFARSILARKAAKCTRDSGHSAGQFGYLFTFEVIPILCIYWE
jgi:hypothetical protein